ncbi:MAG TPA: prenyltransferase/squalene oxidase repeat-containing protein [Solirubrobacteraceae bacterium]|jgi:hypothetical protein|nr:prenyltransferase/squalene oxidase repeat-containing protein [Solirubrobacteraceae bacterium]
MRTQLKIKLAATLAAGAVALLPAGAQATSTPEQIAEAASKGATYLKSLQETSGAIPGFGGDWALTSLAADGDAAANVKKKAKSTDARTWYRELVGNTASWPEGASPPVSEYERAALVAYAAGIDPARVSKTQNLIAQIVAHYQPESPGYYGEPGLFNGTVFGLLALEDAKTTSGAQRIPQALLNESVAVVLANQHTDGGWSYAKVAGETKGLESAAEPDMTGAAIASLCGAGVSRGSEALLAAKAFLKSLLVNASGAFESPFGANTDSTAWAVEGLKACGIDPQSEFTTSAGRTPVDFLISQQLKAGSFKYLASEKTANEYASQDAVRALAGAGFTATPPEPSEGLERWFAETSFSSSATVQSIVTLVVESGASPLSPCAVEIAPAASATTLGAVLEAAKSAATPSGCAASFSSEGSGAITQINGYPTSPGARWHVSIDGASEAQAKSSTAIHLGDTIYVRFS